jgi:hypothetical protein
MRLMAAIAFFLALQNITFGQLIRPVHERLPTEIELTAKVPVELGEKASLRFNGLSVIFDGGSYGASFRSADGKDLVIYFLHPGYWTKEAIEGKIQPIVVDLSNEQEDDVHLEVKPKSQFEKRLLELVNGDLANKEHSQDQIAMLKRVRDCIKDRTPLRELREGFPKAFKEK